MFRFFFWQYNADDQQALQTDPTGGTTVTTYNADGQVASVTDPDGRTKTYTYDDDGNLTQEVWKDSSGTVVDTLSYTYDNDGNLLTAGNSAGTYTFTYNNQGQVTSVTDPNGLTLTYTLDANGNVTNISDNQGGSVTSTYDNAGNLLTEALSGSGVASPLSVGFTYNNDGEVSQVNRYNDGTGTDQKKRAISDRLSGATRKVLVFVFFLRAFLKLFPSLFSSVRLLRSAC